MSLDKVKLKELRKVIDSKLQELNEGVTLELGNCSFRDSHATFKLEVQVKGGDSKLMSDLKQIASLSNLDLDKVHLERKLNWGIFENGNYHFKLAGYKSRARTKPFIVQCQNSLQEFVIDENTCDKWFQKPAEKN